MSQSAPAIALPVLPLKNVAGYLLERRLGRGAMGEVWLGRHERTGQQAAVKVLPAQSDRRAHGLFEVERKAAARLDHPHILPIFEHGEDYLVAAYVRGMDLRQRLRAPLTVAEALRIARAIALALAHAHGRGVVHRDVKPGNVLLDERGYVYLADFGVAALIDDAQTMQNMRAGTHGYMAPEQAAGRAEPGSDQVGLGRTLLAMLLGEAALEASETLPLPSGLPSPLHSLLVRCLAEHPSDRFASMDALVLALDAAAAAVAPTVPAVAPGSLLRSPAAFGWCRGAIEHVDHGHELSEAKHSLRALHDAGLLPEAALEAVTEHGGLHDLGFSVFGCHTQIGALSEPSSLARANEVVVILHGLFCERRFFRRVALELCRRNASRIVITPDLHGMGESPYVVEGPSVAQAAPRANVNLVLELLARLGLSGMKTVLFGHSYAASGLLATPDHELPEQVQRVVLTPVFPHLMASYRRTLWVSKFLSYMLSPFPRLHRSFARVAVCQGSHATGGRLSDELVARMADTITRTPPNVMARYVEGVCAARPAQGALGRCVVVAVPDDPSLPLPIAHEALVRLNIPEDRLFLLASGGHFPIGDQASHPEWTARNVHDLCAVIDEAFDLPAVAASDPTVPQTAIHGSTPYESGPRPQAIARERGATRKR